MAFSDKQIRYKVSLDDGDFQSKLSNLRASLDMTMGGMGGMMSPMGMGFGGMGMGGMGASMSNYGAMMAPMNQGYGGGGMGGLADFGAQIRPITYTPPALSMQPSFGMFTMQQSAGQAFAGAMGPVGLGVQGAANFIRHPLSPQPDFIPQNISASEYMTLSGRAFGNRLGDAASTASLVAGGTAAGLVGSGVGSLIGKGLGGGFLGEMAGGIAGGMLVGKAVGDIGEMMAANRATQTSLESGSFRFITGGPDVDPFTGRGFSRSARAGIADFVQTKAISDMRFDMPEMKQILESGMQLDMFSGAKDAEDFKKRFSGLVETIKTITSTLHTSVKEGMEVMRGFRDMGVTEPNQMTSLTMKAEALGRASGRTGMEMLSLGQTGAEMFRGTGVSMQLGLETNMQNVTLVRQMLNQGTISRETVAQAGGENSLAQQLTASALGATQSAVGRGVMLGMFNPQTGGLMPDMAGEMARKGTFGVLGRAASLRPQDIMNFQAREEEIVSKMTPMQLQVMGVATDLMQARTVTDAMGGESRGTPEYQQALENNFINMEKRRGIPIAAIQANLGLLHTDPEKIKESQEASIASMAEQAALEERRNRFNPLKKYITAPYERGIQFFQRGLTDISTAIGGAVDRTTARLMGMEVAETVGYNRESVAAGEKLISARGGGTEEGRERVMSAAGLGVIDVSGSFYQRNVSGGQNGEALGLEFAKNLNYAGMQAKRFNSVADVQKFNATSGQQMYVLTKSGGGDNPVIAVSTSQLNAYQKQKLAAMPNPEDIAKAEKTDLTPEQIEKIEALEEKKGKKLSVGDLGQALFGKDFGATKEQGFQWAMLSKVSKAEHFDEAAKRLADVESSGGTFIKGAAVSADVARRKLSEAESHVGGEGFFRKTARHILEGVTLKNDTIEGITDEQKLKEMEFIGASGDTVRQKRWALEHSGISQDVLKQIEDRREKTRPEERKKIAESVEGVQIANAELNEQRKGGLGIVDSAKTFLGVGQNGVSGSAAPSQMKATNDVVNQMYETMKLISELQTQVKNNMHK